MLLNATDVNFEDVIKTDKYNLIDFWSKSCIKCRQVVPILESLDGKVKIKKLDIDENPITTEKFNIKALPTLILFADGKEISRLTNDLTEKNISKWLKDNCK